MKTITLLAFLCLFNFVSNAQVPLSSISNKAEKNFFINGKRVDEKVGRLINTADIIDAGISGEGITADVMTQKNAPKKGY